MSAFALNREYELQLPMNYMDIDRDEMEYIDGGNLTAGQKAIIIGACIVSSVAIGAAIWIGAWAVAAKILCYSIRGVMAAAGPAAVASTLIAALGISSAGAWAIVNFCK